MKKKLLSLALALVMCLGLALPTSAHDMGKVGESNAIGVGGSYTGLIDKSGSLWMSGGNNFGQLGNGTQRDSDTFVKVMDSVAAVSCGSYHAAAIKTDGSLWTWGVNGNGELGNGGGSNATSTMGYPCQTIPVKVMDSVAAVSCGTDHTAAIKTDGTLWMWGSNGYGQLGNDGGSNGMDKYDGPYQNVPVKVMDNVAAVSCGARYTAAIKTDGTLWMWGDNESGELGNGGSSNATGLWESPCQTVPAKVMDSVAAVSCGSSTTAVIKTDGTLWIWGSNSDGQLGNDANRYAVQTVPVKVMDNVAAVSCGTRFSAAIKTDGTLWMWGNNEYGQLGNGGTGNVTDSVGATYQTVPVKVMDNVAVINCGTEHTAAIKTDGSLWTWGRGGSGQLGYQDVNATGKLSIRIQTVPKQVEGLTASVSTTSPTTSTTTPNTTTGGFTDVKTGDYFADPVLWAVEQGITSGTSATTFSPSQNCSVAQILTFLWRASGSPKPTADNPFSDVKSGDYFADAAVWAYEKGMVSGSAFSGNTPCTRSMAVTYMWKAADSPSAKAASFTDVPAGADYANAVAWAVEQGVTAGTSATAFSPDNVCTRGQIVTFLYRGLAE